MSLSLNTLCPWRSRAPVGRIRVAKAQQMLEQLVLWRLLMGEALHAVHLCLERRRQVAHEPAQSADALWPKQRSAITPVPDLCKLGENFRVVRQGGSSRNAAARRRRLQRRGRSSWWWTRPSCWRRRQSHPAWRMALARAVAGTGRGVRMPRCTCPLCLTLCCCQRSTRAASAEGRRSSGASALRLALSCCERRPAT